MPSVKQYKVYEKCTDFFWLNLVKYLLIDNYFGCRFIESLQVFDMFDQVFQNITDLKRLLKSFYKLKLVQVYVELTANARESYHQSFTLKSEDEGHQKMRMKWKEVSQKCKKLLVDLESKYSVYLDFNKGNKKRPIGYKKHSSPSRKGIQTSSLSFQKRNNNHINQTKYEIDFEKLINYQSKKESGWLSLIMSEDDSYCPITKIVHKVNSIGNKSYFRSLKLGGCVDFASLEPKVEFNQPNDAFEDYAVIVVQSKDISFALKLYTNVDELISSLRLSDNLYLDFLDLSDEIIGDYQEVLLKSKNNYKQVNDFRWYSLCIFIRTLLTYKANSFSEICSIDVKMIPLLGRLFCKKSVFLKQDDHTSLQGYLASLFVIFFKVNHVISKVSKNCSADVNLLHKTDFRDQIKANSFSMKDESMASVGIFLKRAPNKKIPMWFVPVLVIQDKRFVMFRTQNTTVLQIIKQTETGGMKIEVYGSSGYDIESDGCIFNTRSKRMECLRRHEIESRSLTNEEFFIEIKSIVNYHWIHHETQFTFNINGLEREHPLLHLKMQVASQERLKPVHMNTILHSADKHVQSLESFGLQYF